MLYMLNAIKENMDIMKREINDVKKEWLKFLEKNLWS